jgi:hypothetical protein
MTEKISDELNYSPVISNHSTVLYRTIQPQGNSSITLSANSSVGPLEFIVPPSVFRFGKSRLNFDLNFATSTPLVSFINGNLATTISRIVVYDSATSSLLCDISNFEKYASMVIPAGTSIEDFLTKSYQTTAGVTAGNLTFPMEDISKSNVAAQDTALNINVGEQNQFLSRRQFYVSGAGAIALRVSLPFSAFKFSVLASEKNMYAPSNLVIQVYPNSVDNFAFGATAVGDPTTGAVALTGAVTLSNASVQLATEGNLAIVSGVIDRVMKEGITIPIGYPTVFKQVLAASTTQSYFINLTKAYGNRILAMVTAPFSSGGARNTNNFHSVFDYTSYNSFINNVPLVNNAGFDITNRGEDYILANKEYLKGSAIQNIGEYRLAEWVHVDGFFGLKPLWQLDQHEIDGLDVGTQSSTYSVQFNGAGGQANAFHTAIIGQKMLTLSSMGTTVV